jgi:hypothetical protein
MIYEHGTLFSRFFLFFFEFWLLLVTFFIFLTIFMQIITYNILKEHITILIYESKIFVDIFQIRKFIANKKTLEVNLTIVGVKIWYDYKWGCDSLVKDFMGLSETSSSLWL